MHQSFKVQSLRFEIASTSRNAKLSFVPWKKDQKWPKSEQKKAQIEIFMIGLNRCDFGTRSQNRSVLRLKHQLRFVQMALDTGHSHLKPRRKEKTTAAHPACVYHVLGTTKEKGRRDRSERVYTIEASDPRKKEGFHGCGVFSFLPRKNWISFYSRYIGCCFAAPSCG